MRSGFFARFISTAALAAALGWSSSPLAAQTLEAPIGLGDVGGDVSFTATLAEKRAATSPTAPAIWVLDYGVGRIEVPIFARTLQRLGNEVADTPVGARLNVSGVVKEFRGRVQLDPTSIARDSAASVAPASTAGQPAQTQRITGTVTAFTRSTGSGPHILSVDEGGVVLAVEIPIEVAAAIPVEARAALVKPGARVAASGEKRGAALVLARAEDLKLQAEAPSTATPAAATLARSDAPAGLDPGAVTSAQLRQELVVTGTVDSVRPSRATNSPTRVSLRGASGSLTVVWWPEKNELFEGENAPAVGQPWTVRGTLSEHAGNLQLRAAEVVR